MTDTAESIDAWFKGAYAEAQREHGVFRVPREVEIELSDEYKRRHQILIDAKNQERRVAEREATNERKCEVCLETLPIRRGRPAKRCDEHKEKGIEK